VCKPWNNVPADIKRARTAAGFKRAYARHREAMILNNDLYIIPWPVDILRTGMNNEDDHTTEVL
jgi:hypothetical protein